MTKQSEPKKLIFQTPIKAIMMGMLSEMGADLKCSSILCAPAKSWSNLSQPTASAIGRPIEDQSEYLPPTQSHMGNI